jgi:hypothetical protein
MMKQTKTENSEVINQDPQGGGSYTRNEDGSLTKTEGPTTTNQPAETPADETKE